MTTPSSLDEAAELPKPMTTAGFVLHVMIPGTIVSAALVGPLVYLFVRSTIALVHGDSLSALFGDAFLAVLWFSVGPMLWNLGFSAYLRHVDRKRRRQGKPFDEKMADASLLGAFSRKQEPNAEFERAWAATNWGAR